MRKALEKDLANTSDRWMLIPQIWGCRYLIHAGLSQNWGRTSTFWPLKDWETKVLNHTMFQMFPQFWDNSRCEMGICHQPIAKQDLQLTLRNSELHTGHWRSRRPAFGRNLWSSQTGQNIKYLEIPSSYLTGQNGAVWENLCPPQIAFAKACRCLAWCSRPVFLQFIPNPQWVEINKMWKHANNQS